MSELEKKRRGRPSAKDSVSDNSNQVNDNTDDLQKAMRKKTLIVPKSLENEQEEEEETEEGEQGGGGSQESSNDKDMTDFDKQLERDLEKEFESTENVNDIPEEDSDPLKPNVKDRVYTDGINTNINSNNSNIENAQIVQEREIGEPEYQGGGKALPDVDESLVNPNSNSDTRTDFNDIPKNDGGGSGGGGNKNTTSNATSNSGTPKNEPKTEPKKEEPKQEKSDNLKELSPKEKREAIEKTAEVILLAYQQYCPVPFAYFSEYSERKLEKLHDNNEIDLETPVKRDGTTFRQYVFSHNAKVEEAFVVTDKEIEELREPLIDVLSEQEIAFTPTQRLLFTLGQQLAGKIFLTVKFLREKHSDMKQMREMHQERMETMERIRVQNEKQHKKNHSNNQQNQNVHHNVNTNPEGHSHPPTNNNDIKVTKDEQQPVTPITPVETVQNQEQNNSNNEEQNITEAKVVEMKPKNNKNTVTNTPTLDDVLEGKDESEEESTDTKDEKDNDIPND